MYQRGHKIKLVARSLTSVHFEFVEGCSGIKTNVVTNEISIVIMLEVSSVETKKIKV